MSGGGEEKGGFQEPGRGFFQLQQLDVSPLRGGREARPQLGTQNLPCVRGSQTSAAFWLGTGAVPPPPALPSPKEVSHQWGGQADFDLSRPPSLLQMSWGRGPGVESDSGGRDCRPDLAVYLQRLS